MSSQAYTFKLNADKISGIFDKTRYTISFVDYVLNTTNKKREAYNKSFNSSYYQRLDPYDIIEKLHDVQNRAKSVELGVVFDWLRTIDAFEYDWPGGYTNSYNHYGFELVYEFDGKDWCWIYLNQMSEYRDMVNLSAEDDSYDGCYYLHSNSTYKASLQYLFALFGQLTLENESDLSVEQTGKINEYLRGDKVKKLIEEQLVEIRANHEIARAKEKENQNYCRQPDESHAVLAHRMLYQLEQIEEAIANYDGKIFIFHSY